MVYNSESKVFGYATVYRPVPMLTLNTGEWEREAPIKPAIPGDKGLVVKSVAKHHGISAVLKEPITFQDNKPFIVQYEVKLQKNLDCGGAYLKLLTYDPTFSQADFKDDTPYTIMFGPDKCGADSKVI